MLWCLHSCIQSNLHFSTLDTTMPSVQSLTLTYDALNEDGTFSEGDTIAGKVTLALLKQTTIQSLSVKTKGDARVLWTTRSGNRRYTFSSKTRYFKLKQFLIAEKSNGQVLPKGNHVYNFTFNIPQGNMPSSFKGCHGIIVYKLEANLSRSWRTDRTVEKEIPFVSKSFPNLQSLMTQQVGSTKKEMGVFSKGHVDMDVIIDRRAYAPGETMVIVADVKNSSSSEMTPKFNLIQDVVYRAEGLTKYQSNVTHQVVANCIKSQTQKNVRCTINIPGDQRPTIQNCDIISVEYNLKAYLDISFSVDPEVVFPVVIIPSSLAPGSQPGVAAGPYPAGAVGGPSNSDFPPPAVPMGPYPVSPNSSSQGYKRPTRYSTPPPAHSDYPPVGAGPTSTYPAQPLHMSGGYHNPVPQQASPYGSPFSSSSSSTVLHPPPTAPTFQPHPSAPAFQPHPSAPEFHPSPSHQPFNISPTAPTYSLLPTATMTNTDFLAQSDEAPPAYSVIFPSSASDISDAK